jgi:hypothetical protein
LLGSAAGTALLLFASAAFACTTFKGQMEVEGEDGGTTEVFGKGNAGMTMCDGTGLGHTDTGGGAKVSSSGGTLDVSVAPTTCAGTPSKLPESSETLHYTVNYLPWDIRQPTAFFDCMNTNATNPFNSFAGQGIPLGTIEVNSMGYGNTQVTVPPHNADPEHDSSRICVSDELGDSALMAPFTIIDVVL